MSAVIEFEEWMAELERVTSASTTDGTTVAELCSKSGRSARWVREKLRGMIDAGLVEAVQVRRAYIDGRQNFVPAYRRKTEVA